MSNEGKTITIKITPDANRIIEEARQEVLKLPGAKFDRSLFISEKIVGA